MKKHTLYPDDEIVIDLPLGQELSAELFMNSLDAKRNPSFCDQPIIPKTSGQWSSLRDESEEACDKCDIIMQRYVSCVASTGARVLVKNSLGRGTLVFGVVLLLIKPTIRPKFVWSPYKKQDWRSFLDRPDMEKIAIDCLSKHTFKNLRKAIHGWINFRFLKAAKGCWTVSEGPMSNRPDSPMVDIYDTNVLQEQRGESIVEKNLFRNDLFRLTAKELVKWITKRKSYRSLCCIHRQDLENRIVCILNGILINAFRDRIRFAHSILPTLSHSAITRLLRLPFRKQTHVEVAELGLIWQAMRHVVLSNPELQGISMDFLREVISSPRY